MKLTQKQKNGFYISLTVFFILCFGIVVFLIVRHFKNTNCTPNCAGKVCGDDGCGSTCGAGCPKSPNYTCSAGKCICKANCAGKKCGEDDGCGSTCDGVCPSPNFTCTGGKCICTPNCSGKKCGDDDGCESTCSDCSLPNYTCTGGKCICTPNCSGKKCGDDDGCESICSDCSLPNYTCTGGKCICKPICTGKNCGDDDGCGSTCDGDCSLPNYTCTGGKCIRKKLFVAVGSGPGSFPQYNSTIMTSPDGITWKGIPDSYKLFDTAYMVKFNGTIWVVIGSGTSNTIAYSDDGIIWYPVPNSSTFFSYISSVDWNGTIWLATGTTIANKASILAFSSDGKSWTNIPTPKLPKNGDAICWFKNNWILVCDDPIDGSNSNIYIKYSTDIIITDNTLWIDSTKFLNTSINFNLIECSDNNCVIAGMDIANPDSGMAIYSNNGIDWKNSSIILCCNNIQCIQDIWYASVCAFDKGAFYFWPDNDMTTLPKKCFDPYVDPIQDKIDFGFGVAYDNKKFVTVLTRTKQQSNYRETSFINTSDSNIAPFTWNSIDISDTVGVIDIFYG